MQKFIVDTDVISYLFKNDTRIAFYLPYLSSDKLLAVSFQTIAELYRWGEKKEWPQSKIDALQHLLKKFVIAPYDDKLARIWAKVINEGDKKGKPVSYGDAWIAACALRHSATLLTYNKKDFEGITGLEIISAPQG